MNREQNIYGQLKWLRRMFIGALILAGYGFSRPPQRQPDAHPTGPGGFLRHPCSSCRCAGDPVLADRQPQGPVGRPAGACACGSSPCRCRWRGLPHRRRERLSELLLGSGDSRWANAILHSLALNGALLVLVSLLTSARKKERIAAEICSMDDKARPVRRYALRSAGEFVEALAPPWERKNRPV